MAGNVNWTAKPKDREVLPVIKINSIFFPSTIIKFGKSPEQFGIPREALGRIRHLALLNDDLGKIGSPSGIIGIVCSLQKGSEDYFLMGESRANVVEIWQDKKGGLLARIKELEDSPTKTELTDAEMPMLFGCVESIRRFLKKWQEKVPESESELYKKIGEQIKRIKAGRREKEIIFSMPWLILVNFPDFFSLDFKKEMLRTNKVIDRLQSIAEKLQQEISTFRYAESFADADTENSIRLAN